MDHRYDVVKDFIERGKIVEFKEIFTYLPKTVLIKDWRSNNYRLTRLIDHPQQLSVEEIYEIAALIKVDPALVLTLVVRQFNNNGGHVFLTA
ncbi:hypothetical protein [Paraflavitalea pollutisoli]|uniref:hypothetical protein n=1 Tax=Paraflavitalea pollutisoli TaxID=3034143 RepID=UPI0023EB646A|nr:hypothetical protein [Paraflavitalea sp. H1-2-19X]